MPCTPTDGLVVKQPEARRSDVDMLWEGVLVRAYIPSLWRLQSLVIAMAVRLRAEERRNEMKRGPVTICIEAKAPF